MTMASSSIVSSFINITYSGCVRLAVRDENDGLLFGSGFLCKGNLMYLAVCLHNTINLDPTYSSLIIRT